MRFRVVVRDPAVPPGAWRWSGELPVRWLHGPRIGAAPRIGTVRELAQDRAGLAGLIELDASPLAALVSLLVGARKVIGVSPEYLQLVPGRTIAELRSLSLTDQPATASHILQPGAAMRDHLDAGVYICSRHPDHGYSSRVEPCPACAAGLPAEGRATIRCAGDTCTCHGAGCERLAAAVRAETVREARERERRLETWDRSANPWAYAEGR